MPQILLKGGRVIDPAAALDATLDILVDGNTIAAIGPDLAAQAPFADVIDCAGQLVLPGLIDTHGHVYQYVTGRFGLNADHCGVQSGVTTIIDQGGASCITLPGFRRFVDRELNDLWGWADHKPACRNAPVVFVQEFRRGRVAFLNEGIYAVKGHPECAGGGNWQFAVRRDGRWVSPRALGGQDVPSCHRLRTWDIPRMTGAEQCYDGTDVVSYVP